MTNLFVFALTVVAILGGGLLAGVFFAFSTFVMTALGRVRPDQGIVAMQSINVAVLNPWFFAAFFGTAAVSAVLGAVALANWSDSGAIYLLAGSLFYLVGGILVTMVFNVPLNDALAGASPDGTEGADLWRRYRSAWTAWNHVRTVAIFLATASFIMALRH